MAAAIVHPDSLALTLDTLNEIFFYGRPLRRWQREQAARWIAGRQGLRGSYRGMFAPPESYQTAVLRVFTGEAVRSRVATRHILGEEACRALEMLNVPGSLTQGALQRARSWFDGPFGFYCCGICSVSLWRHGAASRLGDAERRLAMGLRELKVRRQGACRWRAFPFYYTLLALTEMDLPAARAELRYAAPACERLLRRRSGAEPYATRRHDLLGRVLAQV